jgi:ribonuclease P protein component
LRGEIYLKRPADFACVHQQGRYMAGRLVGVKSAPNHLAYARWAIITSKKLGKAVIRNKVKRRLREILREIMLKPGQDIIVIARTGATAADYKELRETTSQLLKKSGLINTDENASPVND